MPPKSSASPYSPPKSDVYTSILAVSLVALIAGSAFLYLDWSQYSSTKPKAPPTTISKTGATPAPGKDAPAKDAPPKDAPPKDAPPKDAPPKPP